MFRHPYSTYLLLKLKHSILLVMYSSFAAILMANAVLPYSSLAVNSNAFHYFCHAHALMAVNWK